MPNGAAVAGQGFDFLMRHACPDGASHGFVMSVSATGVVRDSRRDTYTHAFLLFAFSWLYRATGRADVLVAIGNVLTALQALRHPSGIGYQEGNDAALPRRQNPHMHLLEAFLAAHAATGRTDMLAAASEIHALFMNRFFDEQVLREYFTDDLAPAPGEVGEIIEPGHHFEWVWLLQQYDKAVGTDSTAAMRALADFAQRHGVSLGTGLICNEVLSDGRLRNGARRVWPHTEALKAHLALGEGAAADAMVQTLFAHFLTPAHHPVWPGGWVDRLDARDAPIVAAMPASTFYHLFVAFAEYLGP
jgi:mannose/cellobiose epimerase-like protein (N-acyl-D-glucosamine 2-epimerase family)